MSYTRFLFSAISILTSGGILLSSLSASAASNEKDTKEPKTSSAQTIDTKEKWKSDNLEISLKTDGLEQDAIKLKQDIDTSIVSFIVIPKAKQLIKDMSVRFSTEYPDENERIQAYTNVKKRLILRKNRIDTLKMSEKWKYILQEFLNHMIQLLDKKIAELS